MTDFMTTQSNTLLSSLPVYIQAQKNQRINRRALLISIAVIYKTDGIEK